MPSDSGLAAPPRELEDLAAAGHPGPVLVIADSRAIGILAPTWAQWLRQFGWDHRVRLATEPADRDIEPLLAEARDLGARIVIAAGTARACGRRVAAAAGLPFVAWDTADTTGQPVD